MCLLSINFLHLTIFLRYSKDNIFKLKVIVAMSKVKSWSHHDIAHLLLQPVSLPSINILHLMVSEIQPWQDFFHHQPTHPDAMGKKQYLHSSVG